MTRPFSVAAYVLRVLWDGIPILLWLGLGIGIQRFIAFALEIQRELTIPLAAFGCWVIMYALRPIRKFLMLHSYLAMVRMPIKPLAELGIWKLLLVSERYWRSEVANYATTALFLAAYASLSGFAALRLNRILWHVELVGRPHLAKPARSFLREVNAPLREDS